MAYHTAGIVGSYLRSTTADGFMVSVGQGTNTIAYSTNGTTWTGLGNSVFSTSGNGVAWNGSLWVSVGQGTAHTIATSTDGINWTGRGKTIFSTSGNDVAWNGSLWVAVGYGTNTIATSTDGINWTPRGAGTFANAYGVAWNGSLWVAVGSGTNTIATSTDGITWTGRGTSTFSVFGSSVAWNGSLWVAVGQGTNSIAYSSDGINWTGNALVTFSTRGDGVAWNGSLWVAVGVGTNTIAYSSDGINWTGNGLVTFSSGGFGVAWNGTRWVAVGSDATNAFATSTDGITWTGLGAPVSGANRSIASRQYVLPLIKSVVFDATAGSVQYTGALVGANPAASNQVGGITLRNGNAIISGYIRDALTPGTLDISGGNIFVTGSITAGSIASSAIEPTNIVVPGYIRNSLIPSTLDMSGGNISNSGTTTSTNALVSGYLRNALIPTQFDISGGNISNSGRITTGAGTAAAPSYTFGGDTAMGLYDPAANVLGFATSGAERMRIAADGKVGINCNAPQNTLDISTNSTFDGIRMTGPSPVINMYVRGTEANANTLQFFANSTSGGITQFDGTRRLTLNTGINNTPRLVIGTNGNVAIGSGHTGPEVPLDVSGTADYLAVFRGSGGTQAGIWVTNGAGATTTTGIQLYQNGTGQGLFTSGTNTQPMHFWTGAARRMTILNTGNVGIGTTTPEYGLDVSSTTGITAILRNPSGQASMLVAGAGVASAAALQIYHNSTGQGLYHSNSLPFQISTKALVRLTIDQSGNTGIGTATPANLLDVNGTTQTTNALVPGYLRNTIIPTEFDISGGNISNSGTTTSTNALVSGYLRNNLTATQFDISGGNISNSGRITTGAGTVAAPSYTFGNDASMGLYDPATNVLGLVTSGAERMRIASNGFVGVGTTAPVTRLQLNPKVVDDQSFVYDSSAMMVVQPKGTGSNVLNDPTAVMYLARQGGSGQCFGAMATFKLSRFENAGSGGNLGSRTRLDFDLTHDLFNEVNVMTMRSDGRVGIGTTAPAYILDVSGVGINFRTGNGRGFVRTGVASTTYGYMEMNGGIYMYKADTATTAVAQITNDNNSSTYFGVGVTGHNVGIGTSNPLAKAHVVALSNDVSYGVLTVQNGATFNPGSGLNFGTSVAFQNTYKNSGIGGAFVQGKIDVLKEQNNDTPDSYMAFSTRFEAAQLGNPGVLSEGMRLSARGRLGIGTVAPAYRLDVSEAATTASINMSTWPRSEGSNCLVVRGISQFRGACIEWKSPSVNISTNLGTFQVSDVGGSYLVIRKSGIWSISYSYNANTAAQYATIDVCNNIVSTAFQGVVSPGNFNVLAIEDIAAGQFGAVGYTGYLPSNAGLYYKFRLQTPGAVNVNDRNAILTINFIQEMADGRWPNFPAN